MGGLSEASWLGERDPDSPPKKLGEISSCELLTISRVGLKFKKSRKSTDSRFMSDFSEELKLARKSKGHSQAKAFYQWLKNKGISFNYSYYMRLEQGGLPSEKVVRELSQAIKGEWQDRLILAYCRSLFPKNAYLFPKGDWSIPAQEESSSSKPQQSLQQELTVKQVSVLASAELNYHLFLLSTLARKSISEQELEVWFSEKAIQSSLKQLGSVNLIRKTETGFEALSTEMRFPDAYNQELKDAYKKFDEWDESFGTQLAMDLLINKMLIRRVSGRYLSIIQKQLENLFEIVRSSDEMDARFNDNVLQLKVVLRRGRLPG